MDKHTFKVGDRVIVYNQLKCDCVGGQKGYIKEEVNDVGVRVSFDNDKYNRIGEDVWYVYNEDLNHDTYFQVGDWVRYVPFMEDREEFFEYPLNPMRVKELISTECMAIHELQQGISQWVTPDHCVKIQPPQKDSDDTIIHVFTSYTNKEEKMDIKRKEDGY